VCGQSCRDLLSPENYNGNREKWRGRRVGKKMFLHTLQRRPQKERENMEGFSVMEDFQLKYVEQRWGQPRLKKYHEWR